MAGDLEVRDKYIARNEEKHGSYRALGGVMLLANDTEMTTAWMLADREFVEMSPHREALAEPLRDAA